MNPSLLVEVCGVRLFRAVKETQVALPTSKVDPGAPPARRLVPADSRESRLVALVQSDVLIVLALSALTQIH
jgi:hypothetical protein